MALLGLATATLLPLLTATGGTADRPLVAEEGGANERQRIVIGHHMLARPRLEQVESPLKFKAEANPWEEVGARVVELDQGKFRAIARRSSERTTTMLVKDFPLGGGTTADLRLREVRSFDETTRFVVMVEGRDGRPVEVRVEAPDVVMMAGTVDGEEGSRAFIAHGSHGTSGYVETDGRLHMISSGPHGLDRPTLVFDHASMPQEVIDSDPWVCQFDHAGDAPGGGAGLLAGELQRPCRTIRKAIETDQEFLARLGSNVNAANTYIALLATAGSEIYRADFNINIQLTQVRLWTTEDPWEGQGDCGVVLDEFTDYWLENEVAVDRDLAHFLSGKPLGCGVAASLSGLCDYFEAFCVSAVSGYFPYPLQDYSDGNWDVIVFTHEMGHLLGAAHTHEQTPATDGCGNGYCPSEQPGGSIIDNRSTIMSYCHLCPGGNSNIRLGFKAQTRAQMNFYINQLSCDYEGNATLEDGLGAVGIADQFDIPADDSRVLDVLQNDEVESCGVIKLVDYDAVGTQGGLVQLILADDNTLGRDALNYTPAPGFNGLETIRYTIIDLNEVLGDANGDGIPDPATEVEVEVTVLVGASLIFSLVDPPSVLTEGLEVAATVIGVGYQVDPARVYLEAGPLLDPVLIPMVRQAGTDTYVATLPELDCPGTLDWRVRATTRPIPTGGTLDFRSESVVSGIGYAVETFESSQAELDWTTTGEILLPVSGAWRIGTPDGVSERNDPAFDYDGSGRCALTGPGSGNTDVDGGCTTLVSPPFSSNLLSECSWAHWWHNGGGEDEGDVFTVELSSNGLDWVVVDVFGPYADADGGWVMNTVRVADYVTPGSATRMRFTACDVGEGSIVEAAVDSFSVGICPDVALIPGDVNADQVVDGQDLAIIIQNWGANGGLGDANGDGIVDGFDLTLVLSYWTF